MEKVGHKGFQNERGLKAGLLEREAQASNKGEIPMESRARKKIDFSKNVEGIEKVGHEGFQNEGGLKVDLLEREAQTSNKGEVPMESRARKKIDFGKNVEGIEKVGHEGFQNEWGLKAGLLEREAQASNKGEGGLLHVPIALSRGGKKIDFGKNVEGMEKVGHEGFQNEGGFKAGLLGKEAQASNKGEIIWRDRNICVHGGQGLALHDLWS
ncbi:hypothetical protein ACOSQ3_020099 [Xanthoceras sorbifolium]